MTTDMTHTPAEHVAQRIRMYRTRQHMTIDTLARKLHVSPSTISKYENARLALNVSVLFEIADALNVSVNQLTDYQKPGKPKIEKTDERSFFRRSNIFYMYQYFAIDRKIYPCVMEVQTISNRIMMISSFIMMSLMNITIPMHNISTKAPYLFTISLPTFTVRIHITKVMICLFAPKQLFRLRTQLQVC